MTSLARIRPSLRRAAFVAALGALMVPATAGAAVQADASATKKKKAKPPVVRRVSPMKVEIEQKLEIRGRYFKRGRNKNTVVFKRNRGKAVFVKADVGTTKLLRLTVPAKLKKEFTKRGTTLLPTRFRIRILAKKFGKRFTKTSRSPVISLATPRPPGFVESQADGDCDADGIRNRFEGDDDNDLLSDDDETNVNKALDLLDSEEKVRLSTCLPDSDDDGVEDGFEYRSAQDLNDDKGLDPDSKPSPNPVDGTDAGTDFDGDSLTLLEEFRLWTLASQRPGNVRSLGSLYYSDGIKYSIYSRGGPGNRRRPALSATGYDRQIDFESWLRSSGNEYVDLPDDGGRYALLDTNRDRDVSTTTEDGQLHSERFYLDTSGDGWLSDDERDEDADGLSNYEETHGRMREGWWDKKYDRENPFTSVKYLGTDPADEDSNGDSVRDGADDQDNDDIPNIMELSRKQATGRDFDDPKLDKAEGDPSQPHGRVNPFNPCLPDANSRTCPTYIPFGPDAWAPFDGFGYDPNGDSPNYLVLN